MEQIDFGTIFYRKKRLMAHLGGVQKLLESHPTKRMVALELDLKKDLEEVLIEEEVF